MRRTIIACKLTLHMQSAFSSVWFLSLGEAIAYVGWKKKIYLLIPILQNCPIHEISLI